jgi:hypothetical protein
VNAVSDGPAPRIALVLKGDPSLPSTWSGVPFKLGAGLRSIGCEVVPIDAEIPREGGIGRRLGMTWADRDASRVFAGASRLVASRRLRAAGRVDGIVMLGSSHSVSTKAPTVTFEDMTVVQAMRQAGDPDYQGVSDRAASHWRARQQRNYERCRACCAAANWAAESIRSDYGVPASKVHVVGFGHNVEMDKPERDWSAPRFIFVGGDWARKRGEAIVEAFATVRQAHPEATLDLVGGHPPIDADGVVGHGGLSLGSEEGQAKYRDLLRQSTCFVMPSSFEPLGIAFLDASTAGIPSIGTTSGGAIDAIADTGRAVDPGDQPGLVKAMLELCDPDLARELGDRARLRSDLYTWQAVAERVLRAIEPEGAEVDRLAEFLA